MFKPFSENDLLYCQEAISESLKSYELLQQAASQKTWFPDAMGLAGHERRHRHKKSRFVIVL